MMPRSKHPDATAEKILEKSKQLFLKKGYDNTTIQDIVDELDGLSKGAIYHHFKSKEEVMLALIDRMFFDNVPFNAVRERNDLNGLQKIQEIFGLYSNKIHKKTFRTTIAPYLLAFPLCLS